MTPSRRPLGVALISAATLAFEILLVRAFAIEYFHHFAYMAIGVAMLGFGASGTCVAVAAGLGRSPGERWLGPAAWLTALSLVAAPALVHRIPLDPTQLAWDLGLWPRLGLAYLLLALPFACGALAVLVAIVLDPARPGRVYGASFLGAGAGVALALAAMTLPSPARALAAPAVAAGAGAVLLAGRRSAGAWLGLAVGVAALVRPPWTPAVTPYKALPQVEAYPGARRVAERSSPLGWVVAVDAPAFRHAPGLSLGFAGGFPPQTALFVDGEIAGGAVRPTGDAPAFLDWLPSSLPYALGGRDRVLVIGAGGGTEVWNAAVHGAREITAVELQGDLAELSAALSPPPLAEGARLEWVTGDARGFVARAGGGYDLVTIGPGGGPGASAAGVHALSEDFLHTVEAHVRYLGMLGPGGVLAVTRWLEVPPRQSVRLVLTAGEALRRAGAGSVAAGLLVARSWGTATVLARPSGFTPAEVETLAAWSRRRGFDLDWPPGSTGAGAGFHALDEPALARAAEAAAAGSEAAARFARDHPFEVAPASDARPYPHHFLRAGSVGRLLGKSGGDWLPFAEWGYLAILATLAQSVVLAAPLLALPAVLGGRARPGAPGPAVVGYFGAIGFAYLAAEIAAIQQFGLLLGHPVYAVAAVLAGILTCSGLGAAWSDRFPERRGWVAPAALALAVAALAALSLPLVHRLESAPLAVRGAAALAVVGPLAFLMGTPFPAGLRALARSEPRGVAWAWAANGFASVVAAPLSALIALEAGSPALLLAAAAAYAAAAAIARRSRGASGARS